MYCIEQNLEPGFFCIYENPVVRLWKKLKRIKNTENYLREFTLRKQVLTRCAKLNRASSKWVWHEIS